MPPESISDNQSVEPVAESESIQESIDEESNETCNTGVEENSHRNQEMQVPVEAEDLVEQMSEEMSQEIEDEDSIVTSFSEPVQKASRSAKRVRLDITSIPHCESKCCVCSSTKDRKCPPATAVLDFLVTSRIYIPTGNRVCSAHIDASTGLFSADAKTILSSKQTEYSYVDPTEFRKTWNRLLDAANRKPKPLDFDEDLSDEVYHDILGVSKNTFEKLLPYLTHRVVNTELRSIRNALAIFLAKLRLGVSQKVIGRLFGIPTQGTVSKIINRIAKVLEEVFVPQHLGFWHLSREELLKEHNPDYVRKLFEVEGENIAMILDGTYFYVQQPSDHDLMNKLYSAHKHRYLTKHMMIVTPDGYILDSPGSYAADGKNNDSSILAHLLSPNPDGSESDFVKFLRKFDLVILDRGFRDVLEVLKRLGIRYVMPECLQDHLETGDGKIVKSKKAFKTCHANLSRRVTMVRWVVEAVNGRLKNIFSFFDNVIPNSYLPILGSLVKIACAIINFSCPPIFTQSEKHLGILEQVSNRLTMINALQEKVRNLDMEKNVKWSKAAAEVVTEFPRVSPEDLEKITLGIYQIDNAQHYTDRHLGKDPMYQVFIHREEKYSNIIRVKLNSRFSRAITHYCWIEFDNTLQGESSILGYYCHCQVGARTLGCCSHVASTIWYLGYQRHQPTSSKPKNIGCNLLDAASRFVLFEDPHVLAEAHDDQENAAVQPGPSTATN